MVSFIKTISTEMMNDDWLGLMNDEAIFKFIN